MKSPRSFVVTKTTDMTKILLSIDLNCITAMKVVEGCCKDLSIWLTFLYYNIPPLNYSLVALEECMATSSLMMASCSISLHFETISYAYLVNINLQLCKKLTVLLGVI
ncbi:unnamed protein product [Moneuplotes crassus]|uniref:Uncharacterized protein n=1 Tax=Euplotes crassus TaxID=5936 RepID=A0AAD1UBP2_EUPCR|nr:unnamed protein product [Moneuplotes crassus]